MSAPILPDAFESYLPASLLRTTGRDGLGSGASETIGFVAGVRVATLMGYVAVERLSAGDTVLTADGRHAQLTWVGTSSVDVTAQSAPVRFEIGTMENMRPLRLGPGHRVRVSGWRAELLFEADAVLATAKSFVNGTDVTLEAPDGPVTFVHLMFDRHEIVLAENVPCETLRPGPDGLDLLDAMSRRALLDACPTLAEAGWGTGAARAALPVLSDAEARVLLTA
ncbi:hypothetical protein HKCCSP123_14305 [Rhodobacterales bacterium HKCCSP123]|nr:hypothetical protein [Rhodobacterales bacterium HKCCSP123]